MVGNTGSAADPRRIRRLNPPRSIEVEANEDGLPLRLRIGSRGWQEVTLARRPWRVDQHWWRSDPVRRVYYRVTPEDGPPLTIYYDEVSRTWSRQEY